MGAQKSSKPSSAATFWLRRLDSTESKGYPPRGIGAHTCTQQSQALMPTAYQRAATRRNLMVNSASTRDNPTIKVLSHTAPTPQSNESR
jgi:hypothetical protein